MTRRCFNNLKIVQCLGGQLLSNLSRIEQITKVVKKPI